MELILKIYLIQPLAALAVATVVVALGGCDHATPQAHMPAPPTAAMAQAQTPTMQTGVDAIKSCKAGGLDEATCSQVYHDMLAGRPPQGAATFTDCESKYGAGQCGNKPVPNASGTGSVFLPLVAGAALGALGGYMLSKNLAPKGAYVPPTDWLANRPSISAAQNPGVAAAASGMTPAAGAKASPYAQAPGAYKMSDPKIQGATGNAATQFTPPTSGGKASAGLTPPAQAVSPSKQGNYGSPYSQSGGYNYRAPRTMRPGERSLGQRR